MGEGWIVENINTDFMYDSKGYRTMTKNDKIILRFDVFAMLFLQPNSKADNVIARRHFRAG
jgi:hypothetical protein